MPALPLPRRLWTDRRFLRLWGAGGISAAMMWLEVLSGSLFTLDVTGSGWDVALVSTARAAPLLFGALVGVVADAWDRRLIVQAGFCVSAASAGVVAAAAATGWATPGLLAVAAFVSGSVYATEMPARRRMVAESLDGDRVDAAIAADSVTSYAARCFGPILGGLATAHVGLAGAFAVSALGNLGAAWLVTGLPYRQVTRRLALAPVTNDLRQALAFVGRRPVLLTLLAATLVMNLCGYSYATLMAPLARDAFGLDATRTGLLAAAEPGGALAAGLLLTRWIAPGSNLRRLMGGVAILTGGLLVAALTGAAGGPLAAVGVLMLVGGCGSALYTNAQTSLALTETPAALRSRVMGLITMFIGAWPLGMLIAGALAAALPPLAALAVLAASGLALIAIVAAVQAVVGRLVMLDAG